MTPEPYYNDDPLSFSWVSARARWPKMLGTVIDDVYQEIAKVEKEEKDKKAQQGKEIIKELVELKYDLEHDRAIKKFPVIEGDFDRDAYNSEIDKLGDRNTWHKASWLFSECYLYRAIQASMESHSEWKLYDVFRDQKIDTFVKSETTVSELALRYDQLSKQLSSEVSSDVLKVLFEEFTDISLWGNATDLSMLLTISLEEIQSRQGADARKKNEKNIVVNDLNQAWAQLTKPTTKPRRVDIVLDNAGFELFTDLIFVLFLLDSGLVDEVILHPKSFPWFVSDVVPKDILDIFVQIKDPSFFPKIKYRAELDNLGDKLVHYHTEGKILIRPSRFWTTYLPFWELKKGGALGGNEAWQDLKDSDLVIFKGDLNYRKLTGDVQWPKTTPFLTAIQDLASAGIPVLTLRTIKADVVAGLPQGKEEELEKEWVASGHEQKHTWTQTGQFALIQFSKG